MEVLIGYTNDQNKPETKGTGFAVSNEGRIFVVTCRHIIDDLNESKIIAIPNCRKYVFPKPNENIFSLIKPIFHPKDDMKYSYDVVVFEIFSEQTVAIDNLELVPYNILSTREEKEGSEVVVSGYSVSYLSEHFDANSDNPLMPERSKGNIEKVPLNELNFSGFRRKLKDVQFIKTSIGNVIGKGTSGGAVWADNDAICVGMFIASVDSEWKYDSGKVIPVKGGAFVSSIRIRETIDSI